MQLSKNVVDFNLGEKPCPLRTPVHDQFEIRSSNMGRVRFNFEPSFPKEFQLFFSPSAGTIDKVFSLKGNTVS